MSNIPNSAMHHARAEPATGAGPSAETDTDTDARDPRRDQAGQRGKVGRALPRWPFAAFAIGIAVGIGATIARSSLNAQPRARKKPGRARKAK